MGLFSFLDDQIKFSSQPLADLFGLKKPIKFTTSIGDVLAATAVIGTGVAAIENPDLVSAIIGSTATDVVAGTAETLASITAGAAGTVAAIAIPTIAKSKIDSILNRPTVASQVNPPQQIVYGPPVTPPPVFSAPLPPAHQNYLIAGAFLVLFLLLVKK